MACGHRYSLHRAHARAKVPQVAQLGADLNARRGNVHDCVQGGDRAARVVDDLVVSPALRAQRAMRSERRGSEQSE